MQNTAGPTIFKSPELPQVPSPLSKSSKSWFKSNFLKIAIIILVIVVGAEVFWGASSIFSPNKTQNIPLIGPKVIPMGNARLSLVPERTEFKKGETVIVNVKLFTAGHTTDSTDLVVKYDPAFLKPNPENFAAVGQIYSEYPASQVDEKNGLIGVSGITIPGSKSFSGVGLFAKLSFASLKSGQTQLSIDYQDGSTADSNVVLSGSAKDILGVVDNAQITISDNASGGKEAAPQSCGTFTQTCEDISGQTGTQVCNAGTMNNGVCGYDPKVTVSCEVCKI